MEMDIRYTDKKNTNSRKTLFCLNFRAFGEMHTPHVRLTVDPGVGMTFHLTAFTVRERRAKNYNWLAGWRHASTSKQNESRAARRGASKRALFQVVQIDSAAER
jgi:hypothetical protein